MPSRILAIVPEDFALGFKLTGIDSQGCAQAAQAKEYIEKEILQRRYDFILIDENFLLSFEARFSKKLQQSVSPLIMAIPLKRSFREPLEAKDYFLKMIQDAIGYEIRIK